MDLTLLTAVVGGAPLWLWAAFLTLIIGLLAFDLGVLQREAHVMGIAESVRLSLFYIVLALLFGVGVFYYFGADSGLKYYTAFLLEKTLSLDNIFVIAMIFGYLQVPREYQHRVLFWGIIGVIVLRGIMIGLGTALVTRFEVLLLVFAAFLVFTGVRMLFAGDEAPDIEHNPVLNFVRRHVPVTDGYRGQRFVVREPDASGRLRTMATPLLLALLMVEAADLMFAIDSVPAVLAVTQEPFIVYTSNIFAILGLRALFFALAAALHRFHYLKTAVSLVLIYIGAKILLIPVIGHIPAALSLAITVALLGGGVVASLYWPAKESVPPGR